MAREAAEAGVFLQAVIWQMRTGGLVLNQAMAIVIQARVFWLVCLPQQVDVVFCRPVLPQLAIPLLLFAARCGFLRVIDFFFCRRQMGFPIGFDGRQIAVTLGRDEVIEHVFIAVADKAGR